MEQYGITAANGDVLGFGCNKMAQHDHGVWSVSLRAYANVG
ncbi:hypothetical protein ID866_6118 [Astraeus odoratus]|nr:hypothetical protein ID866_6118 [Astraeus odoratus]